MQDINLILDALIDRIANDDKAARQILDSLLRIAN